MLPDLGIFTVPLLGAFAVVLVGIFTGDNVVINDIVVTHDLETAGYSSTVVTRKLTDALRIINEGALSEAVGIEVDQSYVDKSLGQFEEYFGLEPVVIGSRQLFGNVPYLVTGEVTQDDKNAVVFVARVFASNVSEPVTNVEARGEVANFDEVVQQAALQLMSGINPYIVALYDFKQERTAKSWEFPKTHEELKLKIETPPPWDNYLGYDLIGRMHRHRAEEDTTLNAEQKQKELETAIGYLQAALAQQPDFFYANYNLGLVYRDLGKDDLAEQHFAKAVRAEPNNASVRESWTDMLSRRGQYRDALYQAIAAVEIAPSSDNYRVKLAEMYSKLGRFDQAEIQLQWAHKINPRSADIAEALRQATQANAARAVN